MKRTHQTGEPIMRPMCFDFPGDSTCWQTEDQYMFGPDYLVAPVMEAGVISRRVYLPAGQWENIHTGECHTGSGWIDVAAPLDVIPVMKRVSKS